MPSISLHIGKGILAEFVLLLLLGLANPSLAQVGPVSPYFLTAGQQGNIHVVQGTSVTATYAGIEGVFEYPIAVYDTVFRTSGDGDPGHTNGREYTLAGVPTGLAFALPAEVGRAFDATTDGSFNYIVSFSLGSVYRLDLDFTNPVALFTGLGSSTTLGITYDATNNSLWISSWSSSAVTNYSMSGTVLSSFNAAGASLTSLALDPATGTLWMGRQQTQGTFYEYSKTGTLLQSVTYSSLISQNTLGGEFSLAAIPEPSTWALLALGAVALIQPRRIKFGVRRPYTDTL